jgi:hypothetical protein
MVKAVLAAVFLLAATPAPSRTSPLPEHPRPEFERPAWVNTAPSTATFELDVPPPKRAVSPSPETRPCLRARLTPVGLTTRPRRSLPGRAAASEALAAPPHFLRPLPLAAGPRMKRPMDSPPRLRVQSASRTGSLCGVGHREDSRFPPGARPADPIHTRSGTRPGGAWSRRLAGGPARVRSVAASRRESRGARGAGAGRVVAGSR